MGKVTSTHNEILIVQCEQLEKEDRLKMLRDYLISQMKDGVVIIPPGFSYSILKKNITTIENGE